MPRPPPPAIALSAMPDLACFLKKAIAPARSITPAVPGRTGTLHFSAWARARALSPNNSSCSGVGPTKVSLASAQARAKSAFSDRKP